MVRIEQGQVLRENETDLFHSKQDLAQFSNFIEDVNRMKEVVTAREILAYREQLKKRPIPVHETDITTENGFDMTLKALAQVPKPLKDK